MSTRCPICAGSTDVFADLKVMGSVEARYVRCVDCRFIHAESPHWLEASFSSELNELDIGAIDRCLIVADFVDSLMSASSMKGPRILDWGGGYGVLTRILRDRGHDAVVSDPYVHPIFARNFTDRDDSRFDLIVLSEVLLHLTDPVRTLQDLFLRTSNVLVTAVIAPENVDSTWWYLMPDTGQHVALFARESLQAMADRLGVRLTSDGRFFHLLHRDGVNFRTRLVLKSRPYAFGGATLRHVRRQILKGFGKSRSLLQSDQELLRSQLPWNTGDHP